MNGFAMILVHDWMIRSGWKVGVFAALFVLMSVSVACGEAPIKVSTLDELIKMFDSSSCKECHEKIYEQWEKSHHARSLMGIDDQMLLPPTSEEDCQAGNITGTDG